MRYLGYACGVLFCITVAFIGFGRPLGFQWDFFVFYDAALSWRLGLNPYNFLELARQVTLPLPPNLSFTYPPTTLCLFLPFSFLPQAMAAGAWVLVKCALFALFLRTCRGVYRFDWRRPEDMALLVFGFNSTLLADFTSGNTSLLQFALVWLAFVCLEKRQDYRFAALVVLAASIKIQPVALLAAPLFIYREARWRAPLFGACLFAGLLAVNILWFPDLFREFLREAAARVQGEKGILAPSALALARDLANQLGTISLLPEFLRGATAWLALPFYGLWAGGIALATVWALWQSRSSQRLRSPEAFCFFLLAYVLCVPRVKSYEFILVLPAAAYVLEHIRPQLRLALLLLLCLPVVFPLGTEAGLDIYSSPHLGAVKKLHFLCVQYLPYFSALLLWGWFLRKSAGQGLRAPFSAGQALR